MAGGAAQPVAAPPSGGRLGDPTRVALVSVVAAAVLVTIKLVSGLLTGSLGLVAEAVHSGTDLVAALLTFLALRVAIRPPDREHPYGHGKAEHLAALGEAAFLVLASLFIAGQSIARLTSGAEGEVDAAWWAIALLLVVVVIDASRTIVSLQAARRHNSAALRSNALHFGSDLVGTLAVLGGLLAVRAGFHEADSIAALVVAVLVVLAAARLMRENVQVLMDRTSDAAVEQARDAIAGAEPDVELRRLRIRQAGGRFFVEATIAAPPDAALGEGHAIADSVEDAVRAELPGSDVVVHVEPGGAAEGDLRERASAAALTVRGVREVHNVRVLRVGRRCELSLHLKLPGDLDLVAAHELTSSVERAIREAVPELQDVHTHIEPLSDDAPAAEPRRVEVLAEERAIRAATRELLGREPDELRLRTGAHGLVALVTVALDGARRLDDAHEDASELERRIRAAAPTIAEVVVHTEPREGPASAG